MEPSAQKLPSGHWTRTSGVAQEYPAAHGLASVEPAGQWIVGGHAVATDVLAQALPRGHGTATVVPATQSSPEAQGIWLKGVAHTEPAAQVLGAPERTSQNFPEAHATGADDPDAQKYPRGHGIQIVALGQ